MHKIFTALATSLLFFCLLSYAPPTSTVCDFSKIANARPPLPPADRIELLHEADLDINHGIKSMVEKDAFTAVSINLENFELFPADPKAFTHPPTGKIVEPLRQKPLEKVLGEAEFILHRRPEVVINQEIGGPKSYQRLAGDFLGGLYRPLILGTNDIRGIYVGAMVRRDLTIDWTYESFLNEPLADGQGKVFSRDFVVLIGRVPGNPQPVISIALSHFKSQRPPNIDPNHPATATLPPDNGESKRADQAEAGLRIGSMIKQKYPGIPFLIMADFNNDPMTSKEFEVLRKVGGMVDAIDAQPVKHLPPGDPGRFTEVTFLPREESDHNKEVPFPEAVQRMRDERAKQIPSRVFWLPKATQLDGAMADSDAQPLVKEAKVDGWLDIDGKTIPFPQTHDAREKNPSDHEPYSVTLSSREMLKKAGIDPQKILAAPTKLGPGYAKFTMPPTFTKDGAHRKYDLSDLREDGFLPLTANNLPRVTLTNSKTVVGLKNFGRRVQLQKSKFLTRDLLDKDTIILIPEGGEPVELYPDDGFTFAGLTADGDGFKAELKEIGKTDSIKTVRFDSKGNSLN